MTAALLVLAIALGLAGVLFFGGHKRTQPPRPAPALSKPFGFKNDPQAAGFGDGAFQ